MIDKQKKIKLTDKIINRIRFFLKENEDKIALSRSKQLKKKIDIYEALVSEGYDISYMAVRCAIMDIKRYEREAFIRQAYPLGKTVKFDWGEKRLPETSLFRINIFAKKEKWR